MADEYQSYLASRKWGLLREAVHERSRGTCERCHKNLGQAVHHLTYERKYQERLEDLIHICNACHDYTHGRSHYDPAALRVYMAGSVISKKKNGSDDSDEAGYRSIDRWREVAFVSKHGELDPDDKWPTFWREKYGEWKYRNEDGNRLLIYAGPTISTFGGHGIATEQKHSEEDFYDSMTGRYKAVELHTYGPPLVRRCLHQVRHCDCLFAWIDCEQTVGTIAEITLAVHFNKRVFVVFKNADLKDFFYFIWQVGVESIVEPSLEKAWKQFIAWINE
jgi:hypothetical protein